MTSTKNTSTSELGLTASVSTRPRRGSETYSLDITQVKIPSGFNTREDFGDIANLADSIESEGIQTPLSAYKEGEFYMVVDGNRRFLAALFLKETRGVEIRIPVQPIRKADESSLKLRILTQNGGKSLTMYEQAKTIGQLVDMCLTEVEIAKRSGLPLSMVYFLKSIWESPVEIREMVRGNLVSGTEVNRLLRENNNDKDVVLSILNTATNNGKVKATRKQTDAVSNKANSIALFKRIRKNAADEPTKNVEMFNFISRLLDGAVSEDEFSEMFF